MAIWIAVIGACVVGVYFGGGQSLALARKGEFEQALAAVRYGGFCAAGAAMLAAFVLLGWPFYDEQVSVPEEIAQTVVETVQVPVEVTRWFFWKRTTMESVDQERTVVETIFHSRSISHFSFFLTAGLVFVGWLTYQAHRLCIRFWWILHG